MLDPALVGEPGQVRTEVGCHDADARTCPQQQGDFAGGNLAAADHDAELFLHGKEYR